MRRGGMVITLLLAMAYFAIGATVCLYRKVNVTPDELKQNINYDKKHGTVNILVLGIDEVEAVHRSDTIILARVDLDRKKASVMSIPRDTRVSIKGQKQQQKINHAYAYGGIDLLRDTVVNLTGIPVNYYLILNYASFPKIVDAVGGVDIVVPRRMQYTDKAQGLVIDFRPGKQHMNGADSLKYVRFRKDALGDMGRMSRQQEFAKAFINKVTTPLILPRLPELVQLVLSEIRTDLSVETALQLALQLKSMKLSDVNLFTMPGAPAEINNISYFIADLDKTSDALNALPAEKDGKELPPEEKPAGAEKLPQKGADVDKAIVGAELREGNDQKHLAMLKSLTILNGSKKNGLAKKFRNLFEKAGIEVADVGNASHSGYLYCVVRYSGKENQPRAKALAEFCGGISCKEDFRLACPVALILGKNDHEKLFRALQEKLKTQ